MKKVFITLLVASISIASFAQAKNDRQKPGKKNPKYELNLTEEQKQKMKDLREDFQGKQKELFQQHQVAVKGVLTPEQQSKWEEMRKDKPHFAKHDKFKRNHQGKHRGHGNKNFSHNGKRDHGKMLDETTQSRLDNLRTQFQKEKEEIKSSQSNMEEQRKQIGQLRDKYRNERKTIVKEAREKTKS